MFTTLYKNCLNVSVNIKYIVSPRTTIILYLRFVKKDVLRSNRFNINLWRLVFVYRINWYSIICYSIWHSTPVYINTFVFRTPWTKEHQKIWKLINGVFAPTQIQLFYLPQTKETSIHSFFKKYPASFIQPVLEFAFCVLFLFTYRTLFIFSTYKYEYHD